ncbi:Zinc finger CCHC-type [Trinorchestia longiramus]|nr:Zinc finger CCHC-type [Trinorchestia longiramus]
MADSNSGKSCMKPLNERNYPTRKIHMRMCLVKDKLWDIVQGTETISSTADEAARRKFESRRDLALATIVLGEDQSQLYLLGDPTDPVEVWRKLQNTFQKKSWANKFRLKKKLFNMKLENGQNLQDHLKVCVELFEELAIIGDAMEEEERVIILLSSLPDRFSTLVTALEAHEKVPVWEVVTERLLNEERRQRGSPGTTNSSEKLLVSFKRNKKLIKCFECGKEGHIKRQCRVYEERLKKENRTFQANKAVDARSSATGETTMFTSAFSIGNVGCDSWIVDSGATQHIGTKGYRLCDFDAKRILLSRDVVFNESQFMSFENEHSKEIECVPCSFPQVEKHEDSEGELELRRSTRNRAAPDRFGGWV